MNINLIKKITLVSIALHLIAAYFSTGFHHFDEHFQITEFVNLKLGGTSGADLPWEFREQIRPWFQPFVYFHIYKVFNFLGLENPFAHVFIWRLLTGLFGVFALVSFRPVLKDWFKEDKFYVLAWAFLNLSWFVPYIQVRTSSESIGISFFLLGMSQFLRADKKRNGFLAGLFFGLSYLARFQMALPVAILWFWGVFFRKVKINTLVLSACAILLMIGMGVAFDYWGYGNWTFSLWHYFRTNFLEGIMSNVKQYPPYWYIRWALLRGIPPVSLPLIIVTFWGWWKYKSHPLTWATIPLFLFHSAVGHKELRYIYPVIILAPVYLVFFIQSYQTFFEKSWVKKLSKFLIALNFIILIGSCLKPANPSVNFYKFVWSHPEIKSLQALHESPYTMLGLKLKFYKPEGFQDSVVQKIDESKFNEGSYIFFNRGHHFFEWSKKENCELKYLSYPEWTLNYNIGNWMSRSRVWSLFFCKN